MYVQFCEGFLFLIVCFFLFFFVFFDKVLNWILGKHDPFIVFIMYISS